MEKARQTDGDNKKDYLCESRLVLETKGMCVCARLRANATHMCARERKLRSCAALQLKEGDFHKPLIKPSIH